MEKKKIVRTRPVYEEVFEEIMPEDDDLELQIENDEISNEEEAFLRGYWDEKEFTDSRKRESEEVLSEEELRLFVLQRKYHAGD